MNARKDSERDEYRRLLQCMLLIRRAEERLAAEYAKGSLPGAVHLYIGEEAIAAGACSRLEARDWITSTHRGHGHFLAKGGDLDAMFAEIWGKRTGICRGMGGSMHVADVSKGILGANGIVGGGFAIATGAAYRAKLRGEDRVAVCFFGDGAANQGVFMESMNVSAAWRLPTIFLCENNGLSEFTVSSTVTGGQLVDRARAFMPVQVIDGNDVRAVAEAVGAAVARARGGEGPSYIEAKTYRIRGHLEAEDAFLAGGTYREPSDIVAWKSAERDPIPRFEKFLLDSALFDRVELQQIDAAILSRVEQAVAFAESSEAADTELASSLMFVDQPA
jgi:pyruvate dehydrogenase E1 component alpha subunit